MPQFRLLFHPLLIALAASLALVAARTSGSAAAARSRPSPSISSIRGVLSLLVGAASSGRPPHFPLYVVEAVVVEVARAA